MTPADAPEIARASADPAEAPAATGKWDDRILACVRLAPPLGATMKEIAKGVAGSKADAQYQAIYAALQALVKRGLVDKDGRYYRLPEAQAQED